MFSRKLKVLFMASFMAMLAVPSASAQTHYDWPDWKFRFGPLVHAVQTGRRVIFTSLSSRQEFAAVNSEIKKLVSEFKVVTQKQPDYRYALRLL